MKKLIVLLLVVMTFVTLSACGKTEANADEEKGVVATAAIEYEVEPEREYTEQEANEGIMNYVDERIAMVTKNDAYKAASLADKSKKVLAVLRSLESSGYIVKDSVKYVDGSTVVTFTYSTQVNGEVPLR